MSYHIWFHSFPASIAHLSSKIIQATPNRQLKGYEIWVSSRTHIPIDGIHATRGWVSLELSLFAGDLSLGTVALKSSLRNFCLGYFAWEHPLGICRQEEEEDAVYSRANQCDRATLAAELCLGIFVECLRLGSLARCKAVWHRHTA